MMRAGSLDEALKIDVGATFVDPERRAEAFRILADGGELNDFEAMRRRLDGTVFPCLLTSRALPFGGKSSQVYWAIDLTERRQAEERLRDSEERLRAVMEAAPLGYVVTSSDTAERIFANCVTLEMFGYDDVAAFLDPPAKESWVDPDQYCALAAMLRTDDLVNVEADRQRRDGSVFRVSMNSRQIEFEGQPARVVWLADITERAEAEAKIRESEGKLQEILETSPLGISVVSRRQYQRMFVNRAMAELFGAAAASDLVIHPIDETWLSEANFQEAKRLLESARGFVNFETRRQRFDGTIFWCLLNSSEIVFEGEPAWVIWHNDISAMKAQQQAVQQAMEKADAASRAKSDFLSSMSHELRTPLNAILGYAQLMQLLTMAPLSESQDKSVTQIRRGGEHLLELIDEVLDLAKIKGGRIALEIGPVPIAAALDECHNLVRATADRREVTMVFDESCRDPDFVAIADPTRLRQVILNLLSNAIKYNRVGGRVTVACAPVDGDMLRITVTDTGPGIPHHQWPEVFEPFSRLGAETTDIDGTGIGLTLSRELIDKMGGRIGFTSEIDVGSTFWVSVPMAAPVGAAADDDSPEDPSDALRVEGEGLVLYVQDNPANLQLVELIFEHLDGLTLISAPTGEAGVDMAKARLPDLVLMDIRLPGIDGYEALRRIRADPLTADIPVVALSADAMPENLRRGRAAGFADYLTKPLEFRRLIATINRTLGAVRPPSGS